MCGRRGGAFGPASTLIRPRQCPQALRDPVPDEEFPGALKVAFTRARIDPVALWIWRRRKARTFRETVSYPRRGAWMISRSRSAENSADWQSSRIRRSLA